MTAKRNSSLKNHLRAQVFTVEQIQAAEQPLLEAQTGTDELMQSAAGAVADVAKVMLQRDPMLEKQKTILLAVGAGGNGGDALYAGAQLLDEGWDVEAVLLGRDRDSGDVRVHDTALAAFTGEGGTVVDLVDVWPRPPKYRLVIDGVLGMGGAGGFEGDTAVLFAYVGDWYLPVLSVDVPSGINADTGAIPDMVDVDNPVDPEAGERWHEGMPVLKHDRVAAHVIADVTVTFGGLRRAHAMNAYCGQVVLADAGLDVGTDDDSDRTISAELVEQWARARREKDPLEVEAYRAVVPPRDPRLDETSRGKNGTIDLGGEYDFTGTSLFTMPLAHIDAAREPGPYDTKYSGGVVGVCAGSETYPGAGVLATTGAVRATSSMVRYIGAAASEIIRACPEVVWSPTVQESGRVQAWVVGPGRGTDDAAAEELAWLLQRPEPLLVDADAITLLAERPELRKALLKRGVDGEVSAGTLLTPHDGEFRRLASALEDIPDLAEDRIDAVVAMARTLGCVVLLKGRHTIVTDGSDVTCTDAGTSWGATPGSGDVLSGLAGAMLAEQDARFGYSEEGADGADAPDDFSRRYRVSAVRIPAYHAVAIHAIAACVAAQTPDGAAPTSASFIAEAIPRALARTARPFSLRNY
jgi:hydroxyethylthiazole kinase-like uncharacterized protein yjeF